MVIDVMFKDCKSWIYNLEEKKANEARLNKNYDLSDKIRDKLSKIGINLNDKD